MAGHVCFSWFIATDRALAMMHCVQETVGVNRVTIAKHCLCELSYRIS